MALFRLEPAKTRFDFNKLTIGALCEGGLTPELISEIKHNA